ncbi:MULTISPECIES: hypothetical protein [Burkholderia]|uniref:hypothetical protein n=1 Tax=Burkholderia TaxID=32008 RepID=UPI000AD62618|nr:MULTISPECIES: hypothetical protein [Burkholderia]MCA8240816.1 hypothetical protein [Burkholderia sp. AU32262]
MATNETLDRDDVADVRDEVVERAQRRWKRWDERESENRARSTADLKFCGACSRSS